jgi:hypothetical protein
MRDSVAPVHPRTVKHGFIAALAIGTLLVAARAAAEGGAASSDTPASPPPPLATPPTEALVPCPTSANAVNLILEAHPPLRLGASFVHGVGEHVRLEESLTTGFASLPNLELRGALDWDKIDPLRVWLAYRIRRVDLADLPPIEHHLVTGIGLTSDVRRRISLYANIGVAFQLPPLVDDAAYDLGTYAIENVALVTTFGLRVRPW